MAPANPHRTGRARCSMSCRSRAPRPSEAATSGNNGVDGFLRRFGCNSRLRNKTVSLQAKKKATTGIEPVWTALQRVKFTSSELFAGVFSSARCSEFSSVP